LAVGQTELLKLHFAGGGYFLSQEWLNDLLFTSPPMSLPLLRHAKVTSENGSNQETMLFRARASLGLVAALLRLGAVAPGTENGGYVSLVRHCSFLVRKESLRASMTRSERKSMLYRYSFLEVNKMCQLAERKRGSKSRMLLLAHSCQSLHWTLDYFLLRTK